MIPGPVESKDQILSSMSNRVLAHTEKQFINYYQQSLQNLRHIFAVSDQYSPVVVAGGGTLAMEIAMTNLIDQSEDQTALICETGYFGDRFAALASAMGITYRTISSEVGSELEASELEQALQDVDFAFIQHVDTSTGVVNDIQSFGKLCKDNDVISVVDGVCALGGEEMYQEQWDIDIYLTGAQKALAIPPGLAILMYSPRARELSEHRKEPLPSYYANLQNWWPVMDAYLDGNVKYFSTPPTNLIAALSGSTSLLLDEGMDHVFNRHTRLASKFRDSLTDMGFSFLTDTNSRAVTMSTPLYPADVDGSEFRKTMLEHGVLVAGGIQKGKADQYFRVGHMGFISDHEIDFTIDAIAASIK